MALVPPDIRSTVRNILRRVDLLERRLSNLARRKTVLDVAFNLDGPIYVSASVNHLIPNPGGRAFEIACTLTQAGTTSTVVEVLKNDIAIHTVTIPAGSTQVIDDDLAADYVGNQDRLVISLTSAGTSAEGLNAQVRVLVN